MSSIRKAGVTFYPGVGVSPDLTGLEGTLSLKYKKRGESSFTSVTDSFIEENAGTYTVPLTLTNVGDYIVIIESTDARIENLEGNVLVTNASIDDVKTVVDGLATTLDVVAADVDGLNGQTLDDIKESLNNIIGLINTNSNTVTIDGDETTEFAVGDSVVGQNSGAKGQISSVTYDAGTDVTTIVIDDVIGNFVLSEDLYVNGATDAVDAKLQTITGTPLDSVMEFVDNINKSLLDGTSGLSALSGYTDDIENMLLGTEFLADGTTANPFYDANNPGVAKESSLNAALVALQSNITTAVTDITTAVNDAKNAVQVDVAAVQTVVDANQANLENAGYGLSALKDLLDGLAANATTHDADIKAILNDGVNGLEAIKDTIITKLDAMDTKLDNISGATSSRIFI